MNKDMIYPPLESALYNHSLQHPHKTAIITIEGYEINYEKLWHNILCAASFLQQNNIKKNSKVLLSAQKEIDFIYLYYATHLIGAINIIVDNKNSIAHNNYIVSVTNPDISIGLEIDNVKSFLYNNIVIPNISLNLESYDWLPTDTADIMFTSGTTGNPKGVTLSHFNIYSSANNINSFIKNTPQDIEFLGLPICHSFGLGRLRCNLLKGSTVVLHNGFANLKSVFDVFEKYRITGFGMVPAIWSYIKKFSGSRISKFADNIRYIEIGSSSMPKEDKKLLTEIFPHTRICMHYGLTEASRSTFLEFHEDYDHLDSIGMPVTSEVHIDIFNDIGEKVSDGENGEICISGNMVTKSYFLPDDNVDVFWNNYFRTGDWGYKKDGYLYLLARQKELINVGGKKVSPIEIEDAAEKLGCKECICIPIKDPDGILGEVPKLLLKRGSFEKSIEEIQTGLKSILEPYKIPKIIEIIETIPKTENGKKKRYFNV